MQQMMYLCIRLITQKLTTMKNLEIITAREIELENLLKEAMDALLGAKGSFMAFEQGGVSEEDVKEISKDQTQILSEVFDKYIKSSK